MNIQKIIFLLIFVFTPKNWAEFHIVIDPGHGGSDTGARRDSFIESKIVLAIAEKVKSNLEKNPEMKVTLTRQTNSNLNLVQRVKIANDLQANLFISLHANSSRSTQVTGLEFYFAAQPRLLNQSNPQTHLSGSTEIIEKIKKDLVLLGKNKSSLEFSKQAQIQNPDKKSVIRRAPFYVIENTSMPAVLIEVGFISNRREAKQLATPEYQSEIALLLANSILSYKEKGDKKVDVIEK